MRTTLMRSDAWRVRALGRMRWLVAALATLGLSCLPASPQQAEPAKPAKGPPSDLLPTPAPKPAEAPRPPEARQAKEAKAETPAKPLGQLVNIRIDVKITDERGAQPPVAKVVSLTVADGGSALIRSTAEAPFGAKIENLRTIPLHVDASPRIEGGKVRLKLVLEYNAIDIGGSDPAKAPGQYPKMEIRENLSLVLDNEKPLLVAESPDPLSDRRVNVEVKATILR